MAAGREDFKMTQDEANRLLEALKKEEFRKLLAEYAEEISNPENKKLYEEEITKLEQERGVDVKFIHPTPGHVLKTCLLPSKKKVFVNICCSDLIDAATPCEKEVGATKTMWSIPYSLTPPREDVDKANNRITIFDAIFNPATYHKGKEIPKFCDLIEATAFDGIEKDLNFNIDRKHIKRLKQPYKGSPHPTVMRKRTEKKTPESIGQLKVPYPPLAVEDKRKPKAKPGSSFGTDDIEPKYTVVYSGDFDCQDYTYKQENGSSRRPKRIIVTIELPKLTTAANLEVDIFERKVILHNADPLYHLELPLTYSIDEDNGVAKFHKSNKALVLTLPVIPLPVEPNITLPLSDNSNGVLEFNDDKSLSLEDDMNSNNVEESNTEKPAQDKIKPDWSVVEQWQCPPFSFYQEKDNVSFVLDVPNVKASTITNYFDEKSAQITFRSTCSLTVFSFYVSFPDAGCQLVPSQSSFNVSQKNIVMTLKKELTGNDNMHDWKSFYVGINSSNTELKYFLNEDSLFDIIHNIHHTDPWEFNNITQVTAAATNTEAVVTLSCNDEDASGKDASVDQKIVRAEGEQDALASVTSNVKSVTTNHDSQISKLVCIQQTAGLASEEQDDDIKEEKQVTPTFSNTLIFDLD